MCLVQANVAILRCQEYSVKIMVDCRFANFDVTIYGQTIPHAVRATYGPHAANGAFELTCTQPEWSNRIARLANLDAQPDQAFLAETGVDLFRALFREQVRDLWVRARADLETGAFDGLRIRLCAPAPGVAGLPWEALVDPDRNLALAASPQVLLVRMDDSIRFASSTRPLQTRLPLRILVAIADDPTEQIDAAAEWERIQQATAPVRPEGVQLLALTGRFSIVDLRRRIETDAPDVLHLVTHGRSGELLLWQDGQPVMTPATSLQVVLAAAPSIKLVLLNACDTAQAGGAASTANTGAQLLQAGVPAIIAMQYDWREVAAVRFAEFFYTGLIAGRCPGAIDVAVAYARSNLYALNPHDYSYGTPILWLNAADGIIFRPDRRIEIRGTGSTTSPSTYVPVNLDDQRRQREAIEQWLAAVPPMASTTLPTLLKPFASQLQDSMQEISDLLLQLRVLETQTATAQTAAQYDEKLARLRALQDRVNRVLPMMRAYPEEPSD